MGTWGLTVECRYGFCELRQDAAKWIRELTTSPRSVTSGLGIVLGLWTYGYNIMKNLGNKLTLLSPSRGFCIDVGSATTVILATKLSKPF